MISTLSQWIIVMSNAAERMYLMMKNEIRNSRYEHMYFKRLNKENEAEDFVLLLLLVFGLLSSFW